MDGVAREQGVDPCEDFGIDRQARRREILFEIGDVACAGDRHDRFVARQHPSDRELCRRDAGIGGKRYEPGDFSQVVAEIRFLKARKQVTHVAGGIGCGVHRSREHAASDRGKGDEADAEFTACIEHRDLGIAHPGRIFALHRRDRMDGMAAPDRGRVHLAEPDRPDLPRFDRARQFAHRILDRHQRIGPVEIIEIDHIGAEPDQGVVQRPADRFRPCIQHAFAVDCIQHAFAGQGEFGSAMHHRAIEQPFVTADTVDRGGVEESAAQIERAVDQRARLRFGWRRAVAVAQVHAAQPDGRDGEWPDAARFDRHEVASADRHVGGKAFADFGGDREAVLARRVVEHLAGDDQFVGTRAFEERSDLCAHRFA